MTIVVNEEFCKSLFWQLLYAVKPSINSLTHFLLREDYFPLTLTLSPIGGEGWGAERPQAFF